MRRVGLAAGLLAVGLAVGGGFGFLAGHLTASGSATWPDRPPREGEKTQSAPAARYGNLTLRPTGLTCGLEWVSGTHADQEAHGQFCRLGLAVANVDSTFHDLDPYRQRLVDTAGRAYGPSIEAMRIKRQPDTATIGAHDAIALDVWFDVPSAAKIVAARLVGDDDPSGISETVTTPRVAGGVRVPLRS